MHRKIFTKSLEASRTLFRLMLDARAVLRSLKNKVLKRGSSMHVVDQPITVGDPFSKFFRQTVALGGSLLIVMSFATPGAETGFTADFFDTGSDFIEELPQDDPNNLLIDEEGFIIKTTPATEDVNRIGYTDSVKHTVVSGDTLSGIAALYGISTKTLMWENNMSESTPLKIGQTLVVPALDGVTQVVDDKLNTIDKIAKEYSVDAALIREHNKLDGDVIAKGQHLFVPGGKKKDPEPVIVARNVTRSGTRTTGSSSSSNTFKQKVVISTTSAPSSGGKLIFPTNGEVTQGFRSGHYANDIGNRSQPDIWAAAAGTVVTAKGGCPMLTERVERGCNGGYGNYVVVDHGNGLHTLYAHMQTIYISNGDSVSSGQALGKMGSTGRVYGATGIHLHFEVIDNGTKKNPQNYF